MNWLRVHQDYTDKVLIIDGLIGVLNVRIGNLKVANTIRKGQYKTSEELYKQKKYLTVNFSTSHKIVGIGDANFVFNLFAEYQRRNRDVRRNNPRDRGWILIHEEFDDTRLLFHWRTKKRIHCWHAQKCNYLRI